MHSPVAWRMPVFTAAPLPLLYGWRITVAPTAEAFALVASVDPSSTTRISCHAAAPRRSATTRPIAEASLNAGMTTDVAFGSGISHQLRDDTVPGDGARAIVTGIAERARARAIIGKARDRRSDRL